MIDKQHTYLSVFNSDIHGDEYAATNFFVDSSDYCSVWFPCDYTSVCSGPGDFCKQDLTISGTPFNYRDLLIPDIAAICHTPD
ncbi:hypothetical protein [Allorhodopirellula heiligendammensis]|uniref:hypothetical protein n=1 Tax=Allorhodopirellula heiligendammensis TaxID=2714739 RepID=UPI0011B715D4|nr:hypothetical protein [Allorhodopirellula heiligendammensis]